MTSGLGDSMCNLPTSPSTSTSTTSSSGSSTTNIGAIVGGVIGGLLGGLSIGAIAYLLRRRSKSRHREQERRLAGDMALVQEHKRSDGKDYLITPFLVGQQSTSEDGETGQGMQYLGSNKILPTDVSPSRRRCPLASRTVRLTANPSLITDSRSRSQNTCTHQLRRLAPPAHQPTTSPRRTNLPGGPRVVRHLLTLVKEDILSQEIRQPVGPLLGETVRAAISCIVSASLTVLFIFYCVS